MPFAIDVYLESSFCSEKPCEGAQLISSALILLENLLILSNIYFKLKCQKIYQYDTIEMLNKNHYRSLNFKVLVLIFCINSSVCHAENHNTNLKNSSAISSLESLKDFTKRKPFFLAQQGDAHFIAARCGALYLVLATRIEQISKDEEINDLYRLYNQKASIFNDARSLLNESREKKEVSAQTQKEYAIKYGEITLENWKLHNNIFQGIIDDDLRVCEENFIQYKKLSQSLSK